jgi:hypothetical protein
VFVDRTKGKIHRNCVGKLMIRRNSAGRSMNSAASSKQKRCTVENRRR